ncbi:DsbA family protein [Aromatoleum toluclasticum]|uniref:DsbA family protein n=1 Tax=Aromatoleum toluclasticum TaxID=92003 RepID=UPI001D17F354|nr:DsbA family protein [Aromatoleum toluclasticum]MCC4118008.1 DsbA family protein [Aromatoleum toluclasticum]
MIGQLIEGVRTYRQFKPLDHTHGSDAMNRMTLCAAITGLSLAGLSAPAVAQKAGEMEKLRRDVDAVRQSQDALRKDLDEIKKQLQARMPPPPPPLVQSIDAVVAIGDAPLKGVRDAQLTVMEFSDYQCPFCKRHADNSLPQIDKDFIATGKVRYVFRDFPLESIHPQALKAAEAAHCAGDQGRYWEMHDRLFANQQALAVERLVDHATALDMNAGSFKQCLDSGKYVERIRGDIAEGRKLSVTGTPTLLLGMSVDGNMKNVRIMRGAQAYALLKQELDKLLTESKQ